jgi:MFS transporter, DHA2 family, multidrug resistance protein
MNAGLIGIAAPVATPSPRIFNPWLVALAVVIPTFMEVLDTTIANVALRYIAWRFVCGSYRLANG